MKIVIDRFEGEYAVCELPDGSMLDIPRELFPEAEEGDVISVEILKGEAAERKSKNQKRLNNLFNKSRK